MHPISPLISRQCNRALGNEQSRSTFENPGRYRPDRARENTSRSFSRGLQIATADLCNRLRDREEERVSVAPTKFDKERNTLNQSW